MDPETVRVLKAQAKRNNRSLEEELRALIESRALDRASVIAQLKEAWTTQKRSPRAEEIEAWIQEGRP